MIVGVGVDLVEVDRMKRILSARWGWRFLQRVFSAEERSACDASSDPAQSYAARFAAKEALVKAFGTGFSKGIAPNQIHVQGGERNQPSINLTASARQVAQSLNVTDIHVSLTHTRNAACAFVVVEGNSEGESPSS